MFSTTIADVAGDNNNNYSKDILQLVGSFIEECPYSNFIVYDKKELEEVISLFISNINNAVFLLLYKELPVGMLMASIIPTSPLMKTNKIATEIAFYVLPDYRGKHSFKLVDLYEDWARSNDCKIVTMASLENEYANHLERKYEFMGYKKVENKFIKELK